MAPISHETGKPEDKVVKWFKSFFGVSKHKAVSERRRNRINYEDNVCDAVPGPPRQESEMPNDDSLPNNEGFQGENHNNNSNHEHNNPKVEEPSDEENQPNRVEEESDDDKPNSEYKGSDEYQHFPNNSRSFGYGRSPVVNQTNIQITGGKLHIGSTTNIYNNLGAPNLHQQNASRRPEKSEAVKDIMKSPQKVESGHLECLAGHFGVEWKKIGSKLLFTEGEIKAFKSQHEDRSEISFHMLENWVEQRNATLGLLCKALWDTKLDNAIKAVNDLSVKIHLL
uniref:Death domain-containing protein n=1 Tax=Graphocephala atropunctata TaxID=36148 RepID=A0A1B6MVM2_9HEMI